MQGGLLSVVAACTGEPPVRVGANQDVRDLDTRVQTLRNPRGHTFHVHENAGTRSRDVFRTPIGATAVFRTWSAAGCAVVKHEVGVPTWNTLSEKGKWWHAFVFQATLEVCPGSCSEIADHFLRCWKVHRGGWIEGHLGLLWKEWKPQRLRRRRSSSWWSEDDEKRAHEKNGVVPELQPHSNNQSNFG